MHQYSIPIILGNSISYLPYLFGQTGLNKQCRLRSQMRSRRMRRPIKVCTVCHSSSNFKTQHWIVWPSMVKSWGVRIHRVNMVLSALYWSKMRCLTAAMQAIYDIFCNQNIITKTCLYNFDPLKPHFHIIKLVFTGVYIIFLIPAQNVDCGYSLELPRRGGSNEYPQSMFLNRKMKNLKVFLSKNLYFFGGKIFSIFVWACVRNVLGLSNGHSMRYMRHSIVLYATNLLTDIIA